MSLVFSRFDYLPHGNLCLNVNSPTRLTDYVKKTMYLVRIPEGLGAVVLTLAVPQCRNEELQLVHQVAGLVGPVPVGSRNKTWRYLWVSTYVGRASSKHDAREMYPYKSKHA